MARLKALLDVMSEKGASDLHLTSGLHPYVRIDGEMTALEEWPLLTPDENRELLYEIMPEGVRADFEQSCDVDFAHHAGGDDRFRVNIFADLNGIGGVIRRIPCKIPTADELGLPQAIRDLCTLTKGLVVVTGPTGSGKSTTLAAMIDLINRTRHDHIITIEDPVEFVHHPIKCLINQREIHAHTTSFSMALRAALREDPDIVLVGEMRDCETVATALETAETGHLVFGTLHTNTAAGTVSRIVDKFPPGQQSQICSMLADCLRGVVAQTLCKKIAGGRTAAHEILIVTPGVSSNIRDGKYHYIESSMQTGRNVGMQQLTDSLLELVTEGTISTEEAYRRAVDRDGLAKKIKEAGFHLDVPRERPASSEPEPPCEQEQDRQDPDSEAIRRYRESLKKDADRIDVLNNLAWLLATNPNPSLRNGKEAVKLAARAYSLLEGQGKHSGSVLDTLAAAHAETAQFDKALAMARRSLEIAEQEGDAEQVEQIRMQIAAFEAGRPIRTDASDAPLSERNRAVSDSVPESTTTSRLGRLSLALRGR